MQNIFLRKVYTLDLNITKVGVNQAITGEHFYDLKESVFHPKYTHV